LDSFDYIYMSGGDTSYLLEQSQKSDFISLIKELINDKGKTYIGTSAGSIITGPKLPEFYLPEGYELKDRTCYGFVNFTILPHWGSEHFKEKYLGERLEITYKDTQIPLILLTDNQYVIVRDEQMQIIDLC
jgi:dipeptidase E